MRACEGCRRRKIKCDAATTNQWPCAACVRLKLHCVPPTMNYDRNQAIGGHLSGLERVLDFDTVNESADDDFQDPSDIPQFYDMPNSHDQLQANQRSYGENIGAFHTPPYSERAPSLNDYSTYDDMSGMQIRSESFHDIPTFGLPNGNTIPARDGASWSNDQLSAAELAEVLGELKIDESGEGR